MNKLVRALDHGYRGASKKRHNGIVPIRPSDTRLWKDLRVVLNKESEEQRQTLQDWLPIKVVAHVTAGHRLVGFIKDSQVYLMCVSKY